MKQLVVIDSTTDEVVEPVSCWPAGDRLATHLTRTTMRLHVIETVDFPSDSACGIHQEEAA